MVISNDTIIIDDRAVAIIQDLEFRGVDMVMMINSINTNETGKYVSK